MEVTEVKEKKIEVTMEDGRTVKILRHMLEDAETFGAITLKKSFKDPPGELIKAPPAKDVLPAKNETPEAKEIRERNWLIELRAIKNPLPQEKAAITRLSKKYETNKK